MSEWCTYRFEDFLLFSPRVYWRLVETHNAAWWPLQPLALGAGAAVILLIALRPHAARIAVPLILAAAWMLVGWAFHYARYATINWAAVYLALAFAAEAVLLLVAACLSSGFFFAPGRKRGWIGYGLLSAALLYPLLAPLAGRSWTSAEAFGVAADPTAIATLGVLVLAKGAFRFMLLPIPIGWCLISSATLNALGDAFYWMPLAAAVLALIGQIPRPRGMRPITRS